MQEHILAPELDLDLDRKDQDMKGSSSAHTKLVKAIRLALGKEWDLTLWQLKQGTAAPRAGSHPVPFGLVDGASDLIGILAPTGRMIALEVKTGDAMTTPRQRAFIDLVNSRGGYATIVRSVEGAKAALMAARMSRK